MSRLLPPRTLDTSALAVPNLGLDQGDAGHYSEKRIGSAIKGTALGSISLRENTRRKRAAKVPQLHADHRTRRQPDDLVGVFTEATVCIVNPAAAYDDQVDTALLCLFGDPDCNPTCHD